MRAWVIEDRAIRLQTVPDPAPAPGELLVAVKAVGLNRADLALRAGHYERIPTRPAQPILGLEAAGEVIAAGAGVTGFKAGDRVMGMPSGSYAEKALLHARLALRVPAGFAWEEAAALPVAFLTAHDALVTNGGLQRGETVLIQGASSAVGIVAAQIARQLGAARVFGTSTSAAKLARLRDYGVSPGAEARDVDLIVDMIGANAFAANLEALALGGRLVQVGRVGGKDAALDLDLLSKKRIKLIGVTFRTRDLEEFAALVRAFERDLMGAVAERRLVSPIDRVFPFDAAPEAHAHLRAQAQLGKVVLKV